MTRRRRSLPTAPNQEKLGRRTIMDRALAARHGVAYVHLAVFAIDIDRIREEGERHDASRASDREARPFGWEVFLTESYLLKNFDAERDYGLIEDVVISILEGKSQALGGQLIFAVWDAIARGAWPTTLEAAFSGWKARPTELVEELSELWADEESTAAELSKNALKVELSPPLAPPVMEALKLLAISPAPL